MQLDIIEKMYVEHILQTASSYPPFSYSLPFNYELVNETKYKLLETKYKSLEDDDELDKFVNECFTKYKERYPTQNIGSVNYNPKPWVLYAIKSIVNSYKTKSNNITFPNGCCSSENCPINKFYEIVIEEICLE